MSYLRPSPNPLDKSPTPTSFELLPAELRHGPPRETRRPGGIKGVFLAINDFIGFKKSYNLPLWFIFGGIFFGYCIARLELLSNHRAEIEVAPGEWFWYKQKLYNIGLKLHIAGMTPFGVLAVFQFVPSIRKHVINIHRLNGYIVLTALWIGNAGGLMITRHAFGGTLTFQVGMGFLTLLTMCTGGLAYTNILSLQIDQHRKWMLRTVVYVAAPISARLMTLATIHILPLIHSLYFTTWHCEELKFLMNDDQKFRSEYPMCGTKTGAADVAAVPASLDSLEQKGSAYRLAFPAALWLAIVLHGIAIETYIHLTPREQERLRRLAYERQLEAGMENPGSAGWTGDKLGDGERWLPRETS